MHLVTGISPKYVAGWTTEKAIREIIQNNLDIRAETGCSGAVTWSEGVANVRDCGPGLEMRHLALGISEKGPDSIGKHGEGLKLALLVLCREGRYVEVQARGKTIQPRIENSDEYGTEVLSLVVEDSPPRRGPKPSGTTIRFACTKEELCAGMATFESYSTKAQGFTWMERGRISLPGGWVYVNKAKAGRIENALFSYHLNESEVANAGNRDREVLDHNKVRTAVSSILAQTRSRQVMETLISAVINRPTAWEVESGINYYQIPHTRRRVWHRAANTILGKAAVVSHDAATDREARYRGHTVLRTNSWAWDRVLSHIGVPTALNVANGNASVRRISPTNLTEEERQTLKTAKQLVERHYGAVGTVRVATKLGFSAGDSEIEGIYRPEDDCIYIAQHVLSDLTRTVHVLLHEAVHKHSRTADCTAEFETALVNVAVKMMLGGGNK